MDSLFMALAAAEAEKYIGATAPNPPVGACVVKDGRLLGLDAHSRAGQDHAEIKAMRAALAAHGTDALRGSTLYVTLEPCNHHGKTPPCTDAIVEAGVARVVYGAKDPNPAVPGGGAARMAESGVKIDADVGAARCKELIAPFAKRTTIGRPWVVHKLAYRLDADARPTLIPEKGQKTFTDETSLRAAHFERRRSDAILTGIGTVLADTPLFNVRHVPDHPAKRRWIAVLSRNGRTPSQAWLEKQRALNHEILLFTDLEQALDELGRLGALRVLIEAGLSLSAEIEKRALWDERLVFFKNENASDDQMIREFKSCSLA